MAGFRFVIGTLVLLSAFAALSCGSSHQLQNVTISPSAADAQQFPNGQVQFTAKGTFNGSSTPVTLTSKDITWCYGGDANAATPQAGICAGNIAQFASVDQNGVAQCISGPQGFQGSVVILAGVPSDMMMVDAGPQLKVFGSAVLTCP
jgi:hypothetical protein